MSKRIADITGQRFGKLSVIKMIWGPGRTKSECLCDCGNKIIVDPYRLKTGKKVSCGCDHNERFPSTRRKDQTGKRFGKLVVKEMIYGEIVGGKKRSQCKCVCDCGNEVTVVSDDLTTGKRMSCGCDSNERRSLKNRKDITGKKFNRLTVKEMIWIPHTKGQTKCRCLCDCGNEIIVNAAGVIAGHTKSCGCLQKERASESNTKDWTGVISEYGVKLIKQHHMDNKGRWIWECECGICGEHFTALPAHVMDGNVKSCGCVKRSFFEDYIYNYLKDNNINFESEYKIPDCKNVQPLPFDFAIFDKYNNLLFLIEYDGRQHYTQISFFGGKEGFEYRVNNDKIKTDYCKNNNIDLLRIPYDLSLDDIELAITNELNKHYISVTTAGHAWQHTC